MKKVAATSLVSMRTAVALIIVLTEAVFLAYLAYNSVELILASLVMTVALLIQLNFGIQKHAGTPADVVVFIFNWLFLDLAPKIQLLSMPQQLVNTSSVSIDQVAATNLVCALFIVTFTVCHAFLGRRAEDTVIRSGALSAAQPQFSESGVALAFFTCVIVVLLAAPYAYASIDTVEQSPALLVLNRFLLFLPSATLLILLQETICTRQWVFSRLCVLALLLILVVITENSYTEKRNALGPLYLCLILIAFQHWLVNHNRRMILLVASMVLVFPAISIFTHNHHASLSDISFGEIGGLIEEYYFSINYDSWANIYTAVEIVHRHGMQWGHQLLGSVLFFVPSAIWTSKPLATGIFIARYLIANYNMWFTNLSSPLVAEAYLDFGSCGVIVYGGAVAAFVTFLNKLAARQTRWVALPLATYASLFLMFLLRGSLMVAFGFAGAAFLSFCLASALLSVGQFATGKQRAGQRNREDASVAGSSAGLAGGSYVSQKRT